VTIDLSLKGRHALVCGASRGIGRATALLLSQCGATVTVLARRASLLEQLVPELERAGAPRAFAVPLDLEERELVTTRIGAHLSAHGPVHVLINNTGGPPGGPILEAQPEAFEKAFARHVLSPQLLVQLLLPGMRAAGFGRIINIVSTSVREPVENLGVSNTIRGAVATWAKSVSKELPPGITINNVLPGFTETERLESLRQATAARTGKSAEQVTADWSATVPERRMARPEEIAAAVGFLASPAASYIRGVSLAVDGGRMASI
jgi:3-oxoacyl-[acyl-carrier protein] reductase